MFVAESTEEIRVVTQPDHANLSGQAALHWGNETFETPAPYHSMIIAGEDHDHGWREYDLTPHIHDEDTTPIGFREIADDEWTTFYGSGVEHTTDVDPYGGLMVSLHASGLRRQGYGVRPEIPGMDDNSEYISFVEEQEQFQEEIMAQLRDNDRFAPYITEKEQEFLNEIHKTGEYSGQCRTWYNYLLLEMFDLLAIYFCDNYTLGETTIGSVPVAYNAETTELTVTPVDDADIRIDP